MKNISNLLNLKSSFLTFTGMTFFTFTGLGQLTWVGYSYKTASVKLIEVTEPATNLTIFKDSNIQLVIPEGWKTVGLDSTKHHLIDHGKMKALCNARGDEVWIWCDWSLPPVGMARQQMIEDDLSEFAPMHDHIKTFIVKINRQDYYLYVWRAYDIIKGKKEAYTVFAYFKGPPVFKINAGTAILIGRSAMFDSEGKTEADIIKMVEYLEPYGKAPEMSREELSQFKKDLKHNLDSSMHRLLDSLYNAQNKTVQDKNEPTQSTLSPRVEIIQNKQDR